MENTKRKKATTMRPYDKSLEDNLSMYDHMPYNRDVNICNRDAIALESGNVIKYYRYNNSNLSKLIKSN